MSLYVCAFRGRRDSYQVPLALAESAQLDEFITDAYAAAWLQTAARFGPARRLGQMCASDQSRASLAQRVRSLWGTTALEHLRCHKLGFSRLITYGRLDRRFSLAAASRARKTRSNLLLYSSYAWEAFTSPYSHSPRRVLFQYHPHSELESQIVSADSASYPNIGESFVGTARADLPEELVRRERDCWKHADLVVCASTFTKQSMIAVGMDPTKCRVIPYGIDVPEQVAHKPPPDIFQSRFRRLWRPKRKGLHHLLLAWQRASLPVSSKLLLVCRVMDQGIEKTCSGNFPSGASARRPFR